MANSSPRANCTICVPSDEAGSVYQVECPQEYRRRLDNIIRKYPEIFPPDITKGYRMKDCYVSKKLNIRIRRIEITGRSYTVRPSFVMPYMTAFTDDAEKALFLSKFDVPAWGTARTSGKNGPYWYRMTSNLGRFSLVGTTVRDSRKLPLHMLPMKNIRRFEVKSVISRQLSAADAFSAQQYPKVLATSVYSVGMLFLDRKRWMQILLTRLTRSISTGGPPLEMRSVIFSR